MGVGHSRDAHSGYPLQDTVKPGTGGDAFCKALPQAWELLGGLYGLRALGRVLGR